MAIRDLLYQTDKDLDFVKAQDLERFGLYQQRHELFFLQIEDLAPVAFPSEPEDRSRVNIYGDEDEDTSTADGPSTPLYGDPIVLPVHIAIGEEVQDTEKWGVDRDVDAVAVFSVAVLEDLGINYRDKAQGPKRGDRLNFLADKVRVNQYELLSVIERDYWGNTQFPLHLICPMVLTRQPVTT